MNKISIKNIGKKFRNNWIFRDLSLDIHQGQHLSVKGNNGSGKSTFLQIVSGFVTASEGEIQHQFDDSTIQTDALYKHISFCSPYLDLIDEMSLAENIAFYGKHKKIYNDFDVDSIIDIALLTEHREKLYRNFSSGMKQRLKLVLAFMTDSKMVLFDEPLSNLDDKGFEWYQHMLDQYKNDRIFIVCSNNVKEEIAFCNKEINIADYK